MNQAAVDLKPFSLQLTSSTAEDEAAYFHGDVDRVVPPGPMSLPPGGYRLEGGRLRKTDEGELAGRPASLKDEGSREA